MQNNVSDYRYCLETYNLLPSNLLVKIDRLQWLIVWKLETHFRP